MDRRRVCEDTAVGIKDAFGANTANFGIRDAIGADTARQFGRFLIAWASESVTPNSVRMQTANSQTSNRKMFAADSKLRTPKMQFPNGVTLESVPARQQSGQSRSQ